jgi:hypothetical protein
MLLFLLCSTLSAAEPLPHSFSADYSLHSMGTRIALMKRTFKQLPDSEYLYHSETNTAGLLALIRQDTIIERSKWLFDGTSIKPLQYSYKHEGGKKDRDVNIDFDWSREQITTSVNGTTWQMPLEDNIMDKLLYQLVIMLDLAQGKNNIKYTIADGGKIKIYDFATLGEEIVHTPLGAFQAVKLVRHKPGSKRKTTLWCAIKLGYLPVRVENIETDGRKTTAVIESLTGIAY